MMNWYKMIKEMEQKARSDLFYSNKAGVWGCHNPNTKSNRSSTKRKK